jgi:hypothetical protein
VSEQPDIQQVVANPEAPQGPTVNIEDVVAEYNGIVADLANKLVLARASATQWQRQHEGLRQQAVRTIQELSADVARFQAEQDAKAAAADTGSDEPDPAASLDGVTLPTDDPGTPTVPPVRRSAAKAASKGR